jgi:hypothetical protein
VIEFFLDLRLITVRFTDVSLGIPWKTVLLTVITFMAEHSIGLAERQVTNCQKGVTNE